MRISLTRTGGWANVPFRCTIDTDALPREQARVLEQAIRGGLFTKATVGGQGADGLHYVITVENGGRRRTASFDQFQVPRGADQILQVLEPMCHPEPLAR